MEQLQERHWETIQEAAMQLPGYNALFFEALHKHLAHTGALSATKKYSEAAITGKMDEARKWLLSFGIPDALTCKTLILSFLALCDIAPDTAWKDAKNLHKTLSKDIMQFGADKYYCRYKANSRESFRREAINVLLHYEIIELNPGNPHLGPNSPLTHYAVKDRIICHIHKTSHDQ